MLDTEPTYSIVTLGNGVKSIRSNECDETFHPVIGPAAEAETLYVRQLRLPERMAATEDEFVVWDIGLGAAANAIAALQAATVCPGRLRLVSFDCTAGGLEFALEHRAALGYFGEYEHSVRTLLREHYAAFRNGSSEALWEFYLADFPSLLAGWIGGNKNGPLAGQKPPAPHAILFDAYSPAKNPGMWTQPLFASIFASLDPERPCALATYSRSTMLRVSLMLAGFYVGSGERTGEKEETTIAANCLDLIPSPLDLRWLKRARASTSSEPMWEAHYRQAPISEVSWMRLQAHPQWKGA
jgi:tRNA U34 5-methylaminomethyl-2-thiouridine-forming methyltransferase MnmC